QQNRSSRAVPRRRRRCRITPREGRPAGGRCMSDPDPASAPPYPRRFGWAMRLFLTLLLFDIVFRSFSVCFPWAERGKELAMHTRPGRRATRAEMAKREADGEDASRLADLSEALAGKDGVLAFFDPRPGKETRAKLDTWPDRT